MNGIFSIKELRLAETAFNPEYGLFRVTEDRLLFPNPEAWKYHETLLAFVENQPWSKIIDCDLKEIEIVLKTGHVCDPIAEHSQLWNQQLPPLPLHHFNLSPVPTLPATVNSDLSRPGLKAIWKLFFGACLNSLSQWPTFKLLGVPF